MNLLLAIQLLLELLEATFNLTDYKQGQDELFIFMYLNIKLCHKRKDKGVF